MKIEYTTDSHFTDMDTEIIKMRLKDCKSFHVEIKKGKAVFCFDEETKEVVTKRDPKHDAMMSNAKEVISFLNSTTGKRFSPSGKATLKIIFERMKEGHNFDDFKIVIEKKAAQWKGDCRCSIAGRCVFRFFKRCQHGRFGAHHHVLR